MNIHGLFLLLAVAAILGDTVNYAGHYFGEKVFTANARVLKLKSGAHPPVLRTAWRQDYCHRPTSVPIIRTFAPFVAGAGRR